MHTPAGIEGLIREAGCPCADSKGNPPPFDAKAVPFIKYGMELKSSQKPARLAKKRSVF